MWLEHCGYHVMGECTDVGSTGWEGDAASIRQGDCNCAGALGFPLDQDLKSEEEFSRQTNSWRERRERGGVDVCRE